jgi:uncharacterized protein involved in exopolysaccharide biosynthesis/Mrp family chromosome partitioning ATPase
MDIRRILRRRWGYIAVPTILIVALVAAYCIKAKPQYSTQAIVMLQWQSSESSSVAGQLLGQAVGLDALLGLGSGSSDFATQLQVMSSDDILGKVASALGMKASPAALRQQIKVEQDLQGGNVIDVSVRSTSPRLAQAMANELIDAYEQDTGQENATVLGHSAALVRKQIAGEAKELGRAEARLVAFGLETGTVDPELENSKRVDMLYTMQGDYLGAEQKVEADKADRDYLAEKLRAQPDAIVPSVSFARSPQVEQAEAQLSTLEATRAQLATQFKPADPSMIENQNLIDNIRKQIVADRVAQENGLPESDTGPVGGKPAPGFVASGLERELNPEHSAIEQKIIDLQADMDASRATMDAIKSAIQTVRGQFAAVPDRSRRVADLKDEVEVDRKIYDALLMQMHELDAQRGVEQIYARVLQAPPLPKSPSSPIPSLYITVAAIVGLIVGVICMLFAETIDSSVRGPQDVHSELDLPYLGTIARKTQATSTKQAAEIRELAGTLAYLGLGKSFGKLLITGARSGEGVTFTTARIATALAEQGFTVAAIDANLQNPGLQMSLGEPAGSDEGRGRLELVPAAALSGQPATQALRRDRLEPIVSELAGRTDIVLIDSEAVLGGVGTSIAADCADAVLLVAAIGRYDRSEVKKAAGLLAACGTPIVGVVLNEGSAKT